MQYVYTFQNVFFFCYCLYFPQVSKPSQEGYQNELNIESVERSFILSARWESLKSFQSCGSITRHSFFFFLSYSFTLKWIIHTKARRLCRFGMTKEWINYDRISSVPNNMWIPTLIYFMPHNKSIQLNVYVSDLQTLMVFFFSAKLCCMSRWVATGYFYCNRRLYQERDHLHLS